MQVRKCFFYKRSICSLSLTHVSYDTALFTCEQASSTFWYKRQLYYIQEPLYLLYSLYSLYWAEICDLTGPYVLIKIKTVFENQNDFGLYRDDGLRILRNLSGPQIERVRKDIIKIFKECGLSITTKTNLVQSAVLKKCQD